MAEFKISRLRYTWKGAWVTASTFIKDDVVQYGGQTWVCMRQHTSSAFQTDQDYKVKINYSKICDKDDPDTTSFYAQFFRKMMKFMEFE